MSVGWQALQHCLLFLMRSDAQSSGSYGYISFSHLSSLSLTLSLSLALSSERQVEHKEWVEIEMEKKRRMSEGDRNRWKQVWARTETDNSYDGN